MPYYPTLAEDIKRAREILERGKVHPSDMPEAMRDVLHVPGGAIFGCDNHAAYRLLESFVEAIDAVDVKICELAIRHRKMATAPASITCPRCRRTSHHPKDVSERYCGACHEFHEDMPEARADDQATQTAESQTDVPPKAKG